MEVKTRKSLRRYMTVFITIGILVILFSKPVFGEVKEIVDTKNGLVKVTKFEYIDKNGNRQKILDKEGEENGSLLEMPCADGQTLRDKGYRVLQGGCIDTEGKYMYYLLAPPSDSTYLPCYPESCILRVELNRQYDEDGKLKDDTPQLVSIIKEGINLGHAGDMTYYNGKLVITHYRNNRLDVPPKENHKKVRTITVIDLSTDGYEKELYDNSKVELKDVNGKTTTGIYGIAYNKSLDTFVIGVNPEWDNKGNYIAFMKYDKNKNIFYEVGKRFKLSDKLGAEKNVLDETFYQGIECSKNGIYLLRSHKPHYKGYNKIVTLSWDGKLSGVTELRSILEGENICRVYGTTEFYIGYHANTEVQWVNEEGEIIKPIKHTGTRTHHFNLVKPEASV